MYVHNAVFAHSIMCTVLLNTVTTWLWMSTWLCVTTSWTIMTSHRYYNFAFSGRHMCSWVDYYWYCCWLHIHTECNKS